MKQLQSHWMAMCPLIFFLLAPRKQSHAPFSAHHLSCCIIKSMWLVCFLIKQWEKWLLFAFFPNGKQLNYDQKINRTNPNCQNSLFMQIICKCPALISIVKSVFSQTNETPLRTQSTYSWHEHTIRLFCIITTIPSIIDSKETSGWDESSQAQRPN